MHKNPTLMITRTLLAIALLFVVALIIADSHVSEEPESPDSGDLSIDGEEGAALEGDSADSEPEAIDPTSIEAGEILALDGCIACHGEDGNTRVAAYGNLAGQNERYLYQQLVLIQSKSREITVMEAAIKDIDDDGLQALAKYYASLPGRIGQAEPETNLDLGETIYRGGILEKKVAACTACHGPFGNGNFLAGFPRVSGQTVEYLETQLKAYREGERTSDEDYGGMMRDIAKKLTDGEISAVANYMTGLYQ